MTNKTTLKRLKLDPYFSKTIDTNLNVWSHDQNSYEIKFEFYDHQCNKPIDLTGADMRILLDHADSKPKIYPLEIESKVLGLAKFIMPEQIRGCEGKFTAHIYADYPNRTHDFGSFTFYTKLSRLDGDLGGCMDEIYVSEFEKALEDIKEFKVDIDKNINDMKEHFDDKYEKVNSDMNNIEKLINDNNVITKDVYEEDKMEIDNFRKSDVFQKTYTTLSERGNFWDEQYFNNAVNIKTLGAKGDGENDDSDVLILALQKYKTVFLPKGKYRITKPINLRQGQSIIGETTSTREYGISSIIYYDGIPLIKDTVVLVGKNKVGVKPQYDATDIHLSNLLIDSNNKADFGLYGTYITNDSVINNVYATNSNKYNIYLAKSWYATYEKLGSLKSGNVGIALGMPLIYSDGTNAPDLSTLADLQMNNCFTNNIRSHTTGINYENIELDELRYKGYGIGIGYGYSVLPKNITSETSAGASVLILSNNDINKVVTDVYIERSSIKSNKKVAIYFISELKSTFNNPVIAKNIYVNNNSGGGILYTGQGKQKIYLENVHQPTFLESTNDFTDRELQGIFIKDRVHYQVGTYNNDPKYKVFESAKEVDTRYDFEMELFSEETQKEIWVKMKTDQKPHGAVTVERSNGIEYIAYFPKDINKDTYTLLNTTFKDAIKIKKGGSSGSEKAEVIFKVFALKPTFY